MVHLLSRDSLVPWGEDREASLEVALRIESLGRTRRRALAQVKLQVVGIGVIHIVRSMDNALVRQLHNSEELCDNAKNIITELSLAPPTETTGLNLEAGTKGSLEPTWGRCLMPKGTRPGRSQRAAGFPTEFNSSQGMRA